MTQADWKGFVPETKDDIDCHVYTAPRACVSVARSLGGTELTLSPGVHEVIFPGRLHRVAPIGNVRFLVEFCRPPEAGVDPAADADQTFPHR